jgi:hypothetical protein
VTVRPPAIWVGDLVRAVGTLEPRDDATTAAVALALGLCELAPAVEPTTPPLIPDEVGVIRATAAETIAPDDGLRRGTGARPAELAYVRTERPEGSSVATVVEIAQTADGGLPSPRPLVVRRAARGIVSAALSTHDEDGPVDLGRVVDRLAHGETIEGLPRRTWPTLRHGAQVLLDGGAGMVPYAADVLGFLAALTRYVGEERLSTARFVGCPTRGAGLGPRRRWSRWRPPRPGMPIALVTDLGLARSPFSSDAAPPHEWLAFAAEARGAGCPVVAFIPYRPRRVPIALRRAMAVVQVHERTSAARVRSTLGGVLRRPS